MKQLQLTADQQKKLDKYTRQSIKEHKEAGEPVFVNGQHGVDLVSLDTGILDEYRFVHAEPIGNSQKSFLYFGTDHDRTK